MKVAKAIHLANSEHVDGWTQEHAKDELRKRLPVILTSLKFGEAVEGALEEMGGLKDSAASTEEFVEKLIERLQGGSDA